MKNLLEYEAYLNESNETIKAQGACKSAIFQVQKEVDKLFKSLLSDNLVQSYSSKVKPYNQGYELKIDAKVDYRKALEHENQDLLNFVYKVAGNASIYLQPSTWFEDYLEDHGKATLDGSTLLSGDNTYDDKYPKFIVRSKADIDKAGKQYVDYIKDQITHIQKEIAKLTT